MSASPADRTPGQTPSQTPGRTPNGSLPPLIRRPKPADPLVRPNRHKRRPQRPPVKSSNGTNGVYTNGLSVPSQGRPQTIAQHPSRPSSSAPPSIYSASETAVSGFTSAPIAPYRDYPLVMTKRALKEELRLHVARFASKKAIDPSNEGEFTRPVRLHRRDPRAPPAGGGGKDADTPMAGMNSKDGVLESKEKELQEQLQAERDAQREAEMAQVAPSTNAGGQKRLGNFKKKTQQVFRNNQTEEQKVESKLRYEEALPWHLEDFDNKHTWVGSYEAALSETNVMMALGKDNVFRITPVDKWYKFTSKQQFRILTTEEAETHMNKKFKDPRWFMESQKAHKDKQEEQKNKKATSKLYVGKVVNDEDEGRVAAAGGVKREEGVDDLDFEEQFADDEENDLFEGDPDEAKESEARIKQDQLQANVFNLKAEKSYEKAEKQEKKLREAERKLGKKVRKTLVKREKNYDYYDDSDNNPYSEETESSDSETERLKEDESKKEDEEKKITASQSDKDKVKPTKPNSGNSTKGTNTPSNRSNKPLDSSQRSVSSNSLKRPGSPNISEASGNESSRKKHKKKHANPSNLQTGVSTPNGPLSRPRSPALPPPMDSATTRPGAPAQRKPSSVRLTVNSDKPTDIPSRSDNKRSRTAGAGSGSEGEALSGGEMSDGTRKRIKLHLSAPGSKSASPQASRAASPDIANISSAAAPGPSLSGASAAGSAAEPAGLQPLPTPAELKARIPPEGTTIGVLLKVFKGAVVGKERRDKFASMIRTVSRYEKETRFLYPI